MHHYHHFGGYNSPGCLRAMPRHHHFDGLKLVGMSTEYASQPPFRWAPPPRDFDELCLATVISMGYTSEGCRRVTSPHRRAVGAEGAHIGSK